jgi:hypothetical protein
MSVTTESTKIIAATKRDANKKRNTTISIYAPTMITKRLMIPIVNVGDNIKEVLEKKIGFDIEGRCIVEGYVKPGSCRVLSYSSGELFNSSVMFDVVIECLVCCPVEGMHINCIATNITESAGIKAETDEQPSPVIIYVARDHHINNQYFSSVKINDTIKVRVIGQRFELNDKYISVIAELIEDKSAKYAPKKKTKLVIKE